MNSGAACRRRRELTPLTAQLELLPVCSSTGQSVRASVLSMMRRLHAGLPSMIVIPVGDGVLMVLVSLRPAAL
jgi:hypothetical protein